LRGSCFFLSAENGNTISSQARNFASSGQLEITGFGRHQHLQIGGMQMAACGKIDLGGWLLLQPFEQSFGFFHADGIGKKNAHPS
jgi:hypothetical protein